MYPRTKWVGEDDRMVSDVEEIHGFGSRAQENLMLQTAQSFALHVDIVLDKMAKMISEQKRQQSKCVFLFGFAFLSFCCFCFVSQ